jgi:hypothetical protein
MTKSASARWKGSVFDEMIKKGRAQRLGKEYIPPRAVKRKLGKKAGSKAMITAGGKRRAAAKKKKVIAPHRLRDSESS